MSRDKPRDNQRHQIEINLISEVLRLANRLYQAPDGLLMVKHDMINGFNQLLDGDVAACALYQRNGQNEPEPLAHACAVRKDGAAARHRGSRKRGIGSACEDLFELIARGPPSSFGGNVVVSFVQFPNEDAFAGVAISRLDDKRFCSSDLAILEAVNGGLQWIYEIDLPLASPQASRLTARQRETFLYLLTGARESEIAARMGLGHNTVHHYVKRIYEHFEVSSRRELLDRFPKRQSRHISR